MRHDLRMAIIDLHWHMDLTNCIQGRHLAYLPFLTSIMKHRTSSHSTYAHASWILELCDVLLRSSTLPQITPS